MALTVADIQALSALVVAHKLDSLEFDGLRLTKSIHEVPAAPRVRPAPEDDDEDLLFHSSDA